MDNLIKNILKTYINEQEPDSENAEDPIDYDSEYQNPYAEELTREIDIDNSNLKELTDWYYKIYPIYNGLDSVWVNNQGYFKDPDGKKLDGSSKNQIRILMGLLWDEMGLLAKEYKFNRGSSMVGTVEQYMDNHRKSHPTLYPEWFTVEFLEVDIHGDLIIKPIVDVVKLLESGDNLRDAIRLKNQIKSIWGRLTGGEAVKYKFNNKYKSSLYGRGPQLKSTYVEMKGLKEYIKNVFNKEIKKKIKVQPGGECVHSIVFRARKSLRSMEFQIYPTFKRNCVSRSGHGEYYMQIEFKQTMSKILEEYGWKMGVNYTDETGKDD